MLYEDFLPSIEWMHDRMQNIVAKEKSTHLHKSPRWAVFPLSSTLCSSTLCSSHSLSHSPDTTKYLQWSLKCFVDPCVFPKREDVMGEKCVKSIDESMDVDYDESIVNQKSGDSILPLFLLVHIIYDEVYQVPSMYFLFSDGNGRPMGRGETESIVEYGEGWRGDVKKCFISQNEHPFLQIPFHWVHPCHTANVLSDLRAVDGSHHPNQKLIIMQWMSLVFNAIGLGFCPEWFAMFGQL
eukprot:TRINITY_DN867_c0_g1_i1.p1 TRINITY_DN867_c0_g1~~TRINITY_DN867_c0_g1_i1.p1  ORF type:complete len:239 (-),score=51.86 TRINITY_DN867_c0_g1_i1:32-748(-)